MIPYTGKMLENKLGITFDRASTNAHSVMTTNRKLTADEMQMIQAEVDVTYDQFLSRVAEGRKLTKEQVNVIARGRVWTGRDALEIGLVDEIGGLTDAISYAAKKADIKDKRVLYYPLKEEDKFLEIFEDLKDESENAKVIRTEKLPEELLNYYKELKKLESRSGIQMRLPYDVRFY